jgi:ketosteroid isomerase-like protein
MFLRRVLAMCAVTAIGVGCAGPAPTTDEAGVRAAIGSLRTAVNAGDTTAFFALTADDFEVFPPGVEPLKGAAARELFRGMFAQTAPSLEPFTHEELEVSGDWAMQRYSFRLTLRPNAGGAATTDVGSGLHIWRRGPDGRWRLVKDIWTAPATPAAS